MPKSTNESSGRLAITVLGAALVMAFPGPSMAEPASGNAPAAQHAAQDMGVMKQQMMQQMQQCMNQMPPMSGTDQTAMRQQMIERMHGCDAMKQGTGPDQGAERKPDAHDHSAAPAEPGH